MLHVNFSSQLPVMALIIKKLTEFLLFDGLISEEISIKASWNIDEMYNLMRHENLQINDQIV